MTIYDEWTIKRTGPIVRIEPPGGLPGILEELEVVLEDLVRAMVRPIAASLESRGDQLIQVATVDLLTEIANESEIEASSFDGVLAQVHGMSLHTTRRSEEAARSQQIAPRRGFIK